MEKDLLKEHKENRIHQIFLMIISLSIVGLLSYSGFRLISRNVEQDALRSMEDLAIHDEKTIGVAMKQVWTEMDGFGKFLHNFTYETNEQLAERLHMLQPMIRYDQVYLPNADYVIGSNHRTIYKDEDSWMYEMVKDQTGPFIASGDNIAGHPTDAQGYIFMGVPIEPVQVGDQIYERLVMRISVRVFKLMLATESYNGNGYSCIIDENGGYVVSSIREYENYNGENFLAYQSGLRMEGGMTTDLMLQKFAAREIFYITSSSGSSHFITTFVPLENTTWYYIISVPYSYFQSLIDNLMEIFTGMSVGITGIIASGLIYVFRSRIRSLKQLETALEQAQASNRAKTSFLSNMSHDIRTPMNAIIGYSTLAKSHLDDPDTAGEYLNKIELSSEHLLALISDVLDMSRIESGKLEIAQKPDNLKMIIEETIDMIQIDAIHKNLNLHIDLEGLKDEAVSCDRLRIKQVLLNVLSNAVKFTPQGGNIFITVSQKPFIEQEPVHLKKKIAKQPDIPVYTDETEWVVYEITIQDTGIGISDSFQKIIFEPFAREHSTTISGIPGTGLGLAISKRLMEGMQGSISLHSVVGQGTMVTLCLPLKKTRENLPEAVFTDPKEGAEDPLNLPWSSASLKILVAEDSPFNQEIICELLEEQGFEVVCASNGQEVLDLLAKSQPPFDLIIMDLQMPVMDGLEAARAIRSMESMQKDVHPIPIIALSANAYQEDQDQAMEAGMNGFVSKPLHMEELLRQIALLLTFKEK